MCPTWIMCVYTGSQSRYFFRPIRAFIKCINRLHESPSQWTWFGLIMTCCYKDSRMHTESGASTVDSRRHPNRAHRNTLVTSLSQAQLSDEQCASIYISGLIKTLTSLQSWWLCNAVAMLRPMNFSSVLSKTFTKRPICTCLVICILHKFYKAT